MTYLYHGLRVRYAQLGHEEGRPGVLPAELESDGEAASGIGRVGSLRQLHASSRSKAVHQKAG
jgi:hypothetical protein